MSVAEAVGMAGGTGHVIADVVGVRAMPTMSETLTPSPGDEPWNLAPVPKLKASPSGRPARNRVS